VPELAEVETLRRDLVPLYVGRRLTGIAIMGERTVRRHAPEVLQELRGEVLRGVGRHGKYLLFKWESGRTLVVHLRMSGQLLASSPGAPLIAHTHAVLSFEGASELRFVDPRTFGELFLASRPDGAATPYRARGRGGPGTEIEHLGPDAVQVEPEYLERALTGRRAPLKSVLVDQRVVAGIGNIYADEICFDAGLRPDRAAASLKSAQVSRLTQSIRSVLEAAISKRGSTLGDGQYVDLRGHAGGYQAQHMVYGRAGLPCRVCGRGVVRLALGRRSAFACLGCQR
jgi:formamidopyrimidine-DNA glycosylase